MARITNKKRAQVNKQLWERANNSHRQRWQTLSQKGFDFYLNEQLSKREVDSLEEAGMPTFTINRVTPIVEIMKYFVTANNPRWKAVGATGDDVDTAQVHSDIADYCWYLSNGKSLYSQIGLDSLTREVDIFWLMLIKMLIKEWVRLILVELIHMMYMLIQPVEIFYSEMQLL